VYNSNYLSAESEQEGIQAVRANLTMKKEYDFSKGERGKFYRPDVELNIPVYLDSDVANVVRQHAKKRKTDISALVNEWLRRDIESMSRSGKPKAR
jgi:hypothetical protein